MEIGSLSEKYETRKLGYKDIDEIYGLCSGNSLYYEYCPPFVTRESIMEDMLALPPGKDSADKYYVGFFDKGKIIAVMEFIDGYPENTIVYIGFFMTDITVQGRGVGTSIIEDFCKYFSDAGYRSVRLAWVKGNPQPEHFWMKNGFVRIMETKSNVAEEVILAERQL